MRYAILAALCTPLLLHSQAVDPNRTGFPHDMIWFNEPKNPQPVANLHATVLTALGINPRKLMQTAKERTVARTDKGKVIEALLP